MRATRAGLVVAVVLAGPACDDHADTRSYDSVRPTVTLHGAGATASKALFARWAEQYALVDPAVTVNYDPAGSGAGMRVAFDGSADFGVSDAPLSDSDAKAHAEVRHLPVAVEAVALVYAVAGLGAARLQVTEDVLSDMLTGRVMYWDDAALGALNPGVKLPHVLVRPVYRADQSGTSYLLSEWLSRTSKRWTTPPTRSLTLPVGLGVQKDEGVLARLRDSDGTLAYIGAVTAHAAHLPGLSLRNAAGRFVAPSLEGMRAAASQADLGPDLRAHVVGAPGDLSYPLCSFTYVLVRGDGRDPAARTATARFLWWATHDGQAFAPPLGFGALPGEVQTRGEGVLRSLPLGPDQVL